MSTEVTRRNLFQILGTAPLAAAALSAAPHPAMAQEALAPEGQEGPAKPYKRQTFDDRQWKTVGVLCALIIPADERSGSATQAGVPEFLDDWIAFRKEQDGNERLEAEIFGGLMWLNRESNRQFQKDFADAQEAQQKQLLDRIAYPAKAAPEDQRWVKFFDTFRALTVGGFFSSKMGVKDLPYLGNKVVPDWKGCPPQIWATIQDRMKNGYKGLVEAKPLV
ncbi:MAG: gluconate 2-dehydrogenase subunit 3 family protein [Bryobacteraceae bacterium]